MVLKRRKYHIFLSRILLVCFIAGQLMIYTHQHIISNNGSDVAHSSKNIPQQTVQEKCSMCDVMHHNNMMVTGNVYFTHITVIGHVYKSFDYNFKSIQLILAGGRAPPLANFIA